MRTFMRLALALGVFAFGAHAQASDFITVPVQSSAVEVPVASGGFDWSGFYAGVHGVVQSSESWDTQVGVGVNLGVNAQFDFVLVGAEVALQGLTGDALDTSYGQVLGRAGLVLTDEVMIYAAAGYGFDLAGADESDVLAGAGVEVAVGDSLSLRAQYLHGFADEGANPKNQVTLGANFHF